MAYQGDMQVNHNGTWSDIQDGWVKENGTWKKFIRVTPIDGDWTSWTSWSTCTAGCGGGTQDRYRTCTSPSPLYGGADCTGSSTEQQACNTQSCFSGGSISEDSLYTIGSNVANADLTTSPTFGGSTTINGQNIGNYHYVTKNGQTLSSFSGGDWFSGTSDSEGTIIGIKGNLTINSGVTFKPDVRKLWTVLFVDGDLTLNGEVSMTHRGANHNGGQTARDIRIINGTYDGVSNPQIPSSGGSTQTSNGATGNPGVNGGTGSGGSGYSGDPGRATGGYGAAGTSYTGGSGGGGVDGCTSHAEPNGARGGNACGERAGGGAGNPGGSGNNASSGQAGTGGILVVVCTGTLSGSGSFTGNGADGSCWSGSRSGGGSGGGSVTVLTATNSFSGSVTANGGSSCQGHGGSGTARILSL
jgi:hypothetical protein